MGRQQTLFEDDTPPSLTRLGEQSDISYYGTAPRSILNSPAATGMGFWSVNPYVGCAFGWASCYKM